MEELLSIGLLTYNHERFIDRVLSGIFSQKTNFGFRVYIHDDASSDHTTKIIKRFMEQYPGQIVLFENETNRGQYLGAFQMLHASKGKYLALCDGDDYWISENKLQEQIDFLENNPEYVASCHDALIVAETDLADSKIAGLQTKKHYKTISQFTVYRGKTIEGWELLNGITYIQNCTLIWRKFDMTAYEPLFASVKFNLDWLFSVILALQGKIGYINETWAVYSDHVSGRTKNNYFFDYYFDKIKTLKQLRKLDAFKPLYNRRHIYVLLAKQYNDLLEGTSGGRKTKGFMFKCICWYTYYSMRSTWVHTRYFLEQRESMRAR